MPSIASMIPFASVDLLAVVVTTLALMGLGMIWYGPLFGKTWMDLSGAKMSKGKEAKKMMYTSMFMGLINTFVGVYVLALLLAMSNPSSLKSGLVLGALIWLGFTATNEATDNIWGGKSWKLFWINGVYGLLGTLIGVAILMNWAW